MALINEYLNASAAKINIPTPFILKGQAPLDLRQIVQKKENLTLANFYDGDAPFWYPGMLVSCVEDSKVYILKEKIEVDEATQEEVKSYEFVEVTPDLPENAYKNTTYVIGESKENGKITITPSEGAAYDVPVHGLQDAAYTTVATLESTMDTKDAAILAAAKKYADDNDSDTTYTFEEGTVNGEFKVTPKGGTSQQVKVHGLGSAAYTESTAYDVYGAATQALKDAKEYADGIKTAIIGGATTAGDTLGKLESRINTIVTNEKTYSIAKVEGALGENVKEAFKLVDEDGTQVGETINIYKDSSLISVDLIDEKPAEGTEGTEGYVPAVKGQFIKYTYVLANGKQSTQYVDVSRLLVQAEFKNGLEVNTAGEVSVKKDADSESYLTISGAGVKVAGIDKAISDAVAAEAAIARAAEKANADAIDALEAEVEESAQVTAAALNDLNDRLTSVDAKERVNVVEDTTPGEKVITKNTFNGVTTLTAHIANKAASFESATNNGGDYIATAYGVKDYVDNVVCWQEGSF